MPITPLLLDVYLAVQSKHDENAHNINCIDRESIERSDLAEGLTIKNIEFHQFRLQYSFMSF
jgi:hypothetical protein